jgi:hypothetical protein
MSNFTREQFFDELKNLGEDEVRIRLATKVYGDVGPKRALAEVWLNAKERKRSRDQMRAAWITAIATTVSAIASTIALSLTFYIHYVEHL